MKRALLITALCLISAAGATQEPAPVPPRPSPTPTAVVAISADSIVLVVRRAQRLVNDGSGTDGRALLDSLLERTEPRSEQEAEVLFWRATLGESWDAAQRDYLRIMLEHEGRPRAADAMLRLAQGELARGDRATALRYLERLAREAPESAARAEAGLWHGRLLFERGALAEGCAVLRTTRGRVAAGAIELENQYEFLLRGCPAQVAAPPSVTPGAAPVTDSSVAPPPPITPSPAVPPSPANGALVWSVQVGAFGTADEAADFAAEVRTLGFDARVDGRVAPFRVRFGRFATRSEAQAAMAAYRTKARADAFLVQVPRL